MNNFRKPKNHKKIRSSIDGFIQYGSGSIDQTTDVRRRFRSSYKPEKKDEDFVVTANELSQSINQSEEFVSSVDDLDAQFDISSASLGVSSMDTVESDKKKLKFGFWRRKNRKERKKRSLKNKIVRIVLIFFSLLILAAGSLFVYGYMKQNQIFRGNGNGAPSLQENVDPERLNGEGDGRVNIVLLGKGGPGHTAPDLTDTILLASIDPVQNEVALLSLPRDLYVKDSNGYSTKINAIYSNAKQANLASQGDKKNNELAEDAGLKALKNTVTEVLGVPVHYYVIVNFEGFRKAIDTVGGITIDVKEPLYDWSMAWLNNGNPLLADKGIQKFNGKRALYYARSRHGSARGDFDRTERQREVIVALQKKILSLGTFSNPFKIADLLKAFGDNVRTDLNGTSEIKRLYEIVQKVESKNFISVGLADPPNMLVTTGFVDNQSIVLPSEGLYKYDDIKSFVRNKLRDAFLKKEDARIIILNSTSTAGLASIKEKELKAYGYKVTEIGDAPSKTYQQTMLIDLSSGQKKYTESYLEKRLGVTAIKDTIAGIPGIDQADFVIILGSNEVNKKTTN